MPGSISAGGLGTGLDTAAIIEELLRLERRPLGLLGQQASAVQATRTSVAVLADRLANLRAAAAPLLTPNGVLVRTVVASDPRVFTAAVAPEASAGSWTIVVIALARASRARASTPLTSPGAHVATAPGLLRFQVGGGAVQSVAVDETTTLAGLAASIEGLDAGVEARVVDTGLEIVSRSTGAASTITILQDDTALGLATVDPGADAQIALSGVPGTVRRPSNTITDALPGVTLQLVSVGIASVTVSDEPEIAFSRVRSFVGAFNDVVTFVAAESAIRPGDDGPQVGSLAGDASVRGVLDRLRETLGTSLTGADVRHANLASIGITTRRDGTLALDETRLRAALAEDRGAVARLFAGEGMSAGIAPALDRVIAAATAGSGPLATRGAALDHHLTDLRERIDAGQRAVQALERDLRRQFAALEALVARLQDQASFLRSAFGSET